MLTSIITIIVIWLAVWIIWSFYIVKSIEKPSYNVTEIKDWYEIREYDPYIVAEVEVTGNQQEALNQGFRLLAGYIFWGNTSKQSIAMTSPVNDITSSSEKISMTSPVNDIISKDNKHTVQFILPGKYSLETLPIPNNDSVKLREVQWYTAAALSYTLWATQEKVAKNKLKMQKYLLRDNIEIVWDSISAQYNPPLSFPFLRRNEIIIPINQK